MKILPSLLAGFTAGFVNEKLSLDNIWSLCPPLDLPNGTLRCMGKRCLIECDKGFARSERNFEKIFKQIMFLKLIFLEFRKKG